MTMGALYRDPVTECQRPDTGTRLPTGQTTTRRSRYADDYESASAAGTAWTRNAAGTQWTFKDAGGTRAAGITKAVVTDKSAGLFRLSVSGKKSDFQIDAGQLPVALVVVLGGADQGAAGQCASIAFNATTGAKPRCTLSGNGNVVNCR